MVAGRDFSTEHFFLMDKKHRSNFTIRYVAESKYSILLSLISLTQNFYAESLKNSVHNKIIGWCCETYKVPLQTAKTNQSYGIEQLDNQFHFLILWGTYLSKNII